MATDPVPSPFLKERPPAAPAPPDASSSEDASPRRPPMQRVLVVTSDQDARSTLVQHLLRKGFAVSTAARSETIRTLTRHSTGYDVVLLDLAERSEADSLLRQMQSMRAEAALLIIVNRSQITGERSGRVLDAADFIVDPFPLCELDLRVAAALQRNGTASNSPWRKQCAGELTLDGRTRSCYRRGRRVGLTSREFDLLNALFHHRGCTVSRKQLIEHVWGTPEAVSSRTIDRYVTTIRRKIEEDPSAPVYLQTVYGEGYRFVAGDGSIDSAPRTTRSCASGAHPRSSS